MVDVSTQEKRLQGITREHGIIAGITLFACLYGIFFILSVPPWQHYEEPSHFEYAWLIADRMAIPERYTYDNTIRREIAQSMLDHGFFNHLDFTTDPNTQNGPIWIGINVVGGVPLYYIYEAIPIRLLFDAPVDTQLYATRFFSLILFLGTIYIAYRIASELFPGGHILRWAAPLVLTLIPGFVDIMTALNNDVGAAFAFSLFIWASIKVLLRPFSFWRVLGVVGAAAICALTKNTVIVAVPLVLLVIYLRFIHWKNGYWVWLVPTGLAIIAMMVIFRWGDAADWIRSTNQPASTRVEVQGGPAGPYAIRLDLRPDDASGYVSQLIKSNLIRDYRGSTITIGAWIWASQPTLIQLPLYAGKYQTITRSAEIGTEPHFYSYSTEIPNNEGNVHVMLMPGTIPPEPISVFFSGVVVAEGDHTAGTPPIFDQIDGSSGIWDGQSFQNLVRNGTARSGWFWIRPEAVDIFKKFAQPHLSPSVLLGSLQDWDVNRGILISTGIQIYQTFWAKFGWSSVTIPLIGYQILKYFSGLVILFGGIGLLRLYLRKDKTERICMIFIGVALVTIWGITFLRGLFTLTDANIYIPTARYAYPAIIPTALFLLAGPREWFGRWQNLWVACLVVGLMVLNVTSVLTIVSYYKVLA